MGVSLSVVVCTRDRPDHLRRCLAALRPSLREDDELIVVDSASRSVEPARVAAQAGARVIRCEQPGVSRARNAGWRAATHEHVAWTDDDVQVQPGWVSALAGAFQPDLDLVTGWIGPLPGQEDKERPLPIMLDEEPMILDGSMSRAIGAGANHAVTRRALASVGGYREDLGPGTWLSAAEDIELFDRLFAAGFRGRYEPSARVHHDMWRDRRDGLRLEWRYGKGMGARLASLRRLDPERYRHQAREALWTTGAKVIGREVRIGYEYGALADVVRLAGTAVGAAAATGARLGVRPGRR